MDSLTRSPCKGIDKRSSAELSEAINSMWSWYRNADRCVAYLSDVTSTGTVLDKWLQFNQSEWFTRGWTLQELLAPTAVTFCDSEWNTIGTLSAGFRWDTNATLQHVSLAAGIDMKYLRGDHSERSRNITDACVAQKLSWASRRRTTRPEDLSYCLLGLVEVNMPLLYGEGGQRAFIRLQQEIIKQSDDESIFAWQRNSMLDEPFGLLAPEIRYFRHTIRPEPIPVIEVGNQYTAPYAVTNRGVQMQTVAYPVLSTVSIQKEEPTPGAFNHQKTAPIPILLVEEPDEDLSKSGGRKEPVHLNVSDETPQISTSETEDRFLIKLNCSSIDTTLQEPHARQRCAIVVRKGAGGASTRVMAGSLHPHVMSAGHPVARVGDPVPRNFVVKLTSRY